MDPDTCALIIFMLARFFTMNSSLLLIDWSEKLSSLLNHPGPEDHCTLYSLDVLAIYYLFNFGTVCSAFELHNYLVYRQQH